jgi:hypothetical protein
LFVFSSSQILSGSYNNFFKSFNRNTKQELMFECSRDQARPRQQLRPKRVTSSAPNGGSGTPQTGSASPSLNKRSNMLNGKLAPASNGLYKDEVSVDSLDFTKKILHTSWHPKDNIIAIAATNNLYIYYTKDGSAINGNHSSAASHFNTNTINCFNSSSSSNNTSASLLSSAVGATHLTVANGPVTVGVNESSCLTLNTSFYTPSSSSSSTSSSANSSATCSPQQSAATLLTSNASTNGGVVELTPVVDASASVLSVAAAAIPPLTTANSMSL